MSTAFKLYYSDEGAPYYYDSATGRSMWAAPTDWVSQRDPDGRLFFSNSVTHEVTWGDRVTTALPEMLSPGGGTRWDADAATPANRPLHRAHLEDAVATSALRAPTASGHRGAGSGGDFDAEAGGFAGDEEADDYPEAAWVAPTVGLSSYGPGRSASPLSRAAGHFTPAEQLAAARGFGAASSRRLHYPQQQFQASPFAGAAAAVTPPAKARRHRRERAERNIMEARTRAQLAADAAASLGPYASDTTYDGHGPAAWASAPAGGAAAAAAAQRHRGGGVGATFSEPPWMQQQTSAAGGRPRSQTAARVSGGPRSYGQGSAGPLQARGAVAAAAPSAHGEWLSVLPADASRPQAAGAGRGGSRVRSAGGAAARSALRSGAGSGGEESAAYSAWRRGDSGAGSGVRRTGMQDGFGGHEGHAGSWGHAVRGASGGEQFRSDGEGDSDAEEREGPRAHDEEGIGEEEEEEEDEEEGEGGSAGGAGEDAGSAASSPSSVFRGAGGGLLGLFDLCGLSLLQDDGGASAPGTPGGATAPALLRAGSHAAAAGAALRSPGQVEAGALPSPPPHGGPRLPPHRGGGSGSAGRGSTAGGAPSPASRLGDGSGGSPGSPRTQAALRFVGMSLEERTGWLRGALSRFGGSLLSRSQLLAIYLASKSLPFVAAFLAAAASRGGDSLRVVRSVAEAAVRTLSPKSAPTLLPRHDPSATSSAAGDAASVDPGGPGGAAAMPAAAAWGGGGGRFFGSGHPGASGRTAGRGYHAAAATASRLHEDDDAAYLSAVSPGSVVSPTRYVRAAAAGGLMFAPAGAAGAWRGGGAGHGAGAEESGACAGELYSCGSAVGGLEEGGAGGGRSGPAAEPPAGSLIERLFSPAHISRLIPRVASAAASAASSLTSGAAAAAASAGRGLAASVQPRSATGDRVLPVASGSALQLGAGPPLRAAPVRAAPGDGLRSAARAGAPGRQTAAAALGAGAAAAEGSGLEEGLPCAPPQHRRADASRGVPCRSARGTGIAAASPPPKAAARGQLHRAADGATLTAGAAASLSHACRPSDPNTAFGPYALQVLASDTTIVDDDCEAGGGGGGGTADQHSALQLQPAASLGLRMLGAASAAGGAGAPLLASAFQWHPTADECRHAAADTALSDDAGFGAPGGLAAASEEAGFWGDVPLDSSLSSPPGSTWRPASLFGSAASEASAVQSGALLPDPANQHAGVAAFLYAADAGSGLPDVTHHTDCGLPVTHHPAPRSQTLASFQRGGSAHPAAGAAFDAAFYAEHSSIGAAGTGRRQGAQTQLPQERNVDTAAVPYNAADVTANGSFCSVGESDWHPGLEHSPVRRRLSAELVQALVEPLQQQRNADNGDGDEAEPMGSTRRHRVNVAETQEATEDNSLASDAVASANDTAWRSQDASGPAVGEEAHLASETITTATFTMPRLDNHSGLRRPCESSREGEAAGAEALSLGHASAEAVRADQHVRSRDLPWPIDGEVAGAAVSTPHTNRRAHPASPAAAKALRPHSSGSTGESPMTSPAACFTPQSPPEASVDRSAARSAAAAGAT